MTCIVGLVSSEGTVWMGADSVGSDGYIKQQRKDSKIFFKTSSTGQKMLIGYTSSFRMGQLLAYKLSLPHHELGRDVHEWLCTDFIDQVRKVLAENGWMGKYQDRDSGGQFLVGYMGRLFTVDNDFQVAENLINMAAVGCGDQIALGSMFTSVRADWHPSETLNAALAAASEFSTGVGGPFHILNIEDEKE